MDSNLSGFGRQSGPSAPAKSVVFGQAIPPSSSSRFSPFFNHLENFINFFSDFVFLLHSCILVDLDFDFDILIVIEVSLSIDVTLSKHCSTSIEREYVNVAVFIFP